MTILSPRPNRASKNVVTTKTCDDVILIIKIPSEYQLDDPRSHPPGYHDGEQDRTELTEESSHLPHLNYCATTDRFTGPWRHLSDRKTWTITFKTENIVSQHTSYVIYVIIILYNIDQCPLPNKAMVAVLARMVIKVYLSVR